jgi:type III restriction enzyme
LPDRKQFEISWPNVIRVDYEFRPTLSLDPGNVKPLALDATETRLLAEIAPIVDGKPHDEHTAQIKLQELAQRYRMQTVIFETGNDLYDQISKDWKGNRDYLLAQLIRLVECFIASGHIHVTPAFFAQDDLRRRLVFILNMSSIVQHLVTAIRFENAKSLVPVLDPERPLRSTGDMLPWSTRKPCEKTRRSHINFCVFDSTWEASEAFELDRNDHVAAWTKNDHLGFEITYTHKGIVRAFRPDYLVRLKNGVNLVLEVKGQEDQEQRTKRDFLSEWITAVNSDGRFGTWASAVSYAPRDLPDLLDGAAKG